MPAYFILRNRILDAAGMREYIPKALETMKPFAARLLVLDESSEIVEGRTDFPRTIVIQFASREDAMAWYRSPAYRAVLPLRLEATEGIAMIVDGFPS